jgi:hypothetical protein
MERGLSILWIDAICGSVQNSMTPPEKNVVRRVGSANSVGKPTLYERGCHRPIFAHHTAANHPGAERNFLVERFRASGRSAEVARVGQTDQNQPFMTAPPASRFSAKPTIRSRVTRR